MALRGKVRKIGVLILFWIICYVPILHAAWPLGGDLPVPPQTEESQPTTKKIIRGKEMNMYFYTSDLNQNEIKEFYQEKLTARGWTLVDLKKELAKVPQVPQVTLSGSMNEGTVFEKDNHTIVITFVNLGDGQTRYGLTQGPSRQKNEAPPKSILDVIPRVVGKPKKDVFPVFPGAALTSLIEKPSIIRAVYMVDSDANQVTAFYKEKMQDYNWELQTETDPQQIDLTNPDPASCPSCPKRASGGPPPIDLWFKEMSFLSQKGDTCKIVITNMIGKKNTPVPLNLTTIMVSYYEKTK